MINQNHSRNQDSEGKSQISQNTNFPNFIGARMKELGLYEGPDLDSLPPIVKDMMEILLNHVLEVSKVKNISWKISCTASECFTYIEHPHETVEYQRDHDCIVHEPIIVEAYEYAHEFMKIRICPVDAKSNKENGSQGILLFEPLIEDLRERFKNYYPEQIASMMTYDIMCLTREIN